MRRIVLPIALALSVCGLVTGSALVHVPDQAPTAQQEYLADPTPAETPDMALAVAPSTTTPQPTTSSSAPSATQTTTSSAPATQRTSAKPLNAPAKAQDQPPAPARDAVQQLPLPYEGSAGQVITVVAPSRTSTTASLTAWVRDGTGWRAEIGPMTANVGSMGIGQASETVSRTPAGVFGLTEAFGILGDNGTKLPYFKVDDSDWWVSDVNSPDYNTHFRCAQGSCPFNERAGERLIAAGAVYNHAVVINYNRNPPQPGAGSAFFLHVSNGRATAGCVSVPADQLDAIMRWLEPSQDPVINIG